MSRGGRIVAIGGGVVVVAAAVAAVALGVVGVGQTVAAGSQAQVCGVTVGVSVSDGTVRLLGVSDETLAPGDRVRVSPLCVVEVVAIDGGDDPDDDGGAHVELRWRLW